MDHTSPECSPAGAKYVQIIEEQPEAADPATTATQAPGAKPDPR